MKIRITADSTCDLSPELIEKYNVKIMPLFVSLGSDNMLDGIGITPQDIYDYYANTKMLPKTGARSVEDYRDFYLQTLAEGYDGIVHFVISSDMSVSYNNAAKGAEGLNVFVVDSRNLSTGIGLLVLDACDAAAAGKTAKEI
ncbi:MAG TPA: DegV family protein, partial [Candidatus Fimimonas merdipullorum]|nr:DegV family protein [Candidatus Fimimonas merdipullorum]